MLEVLNTQAKNKRSTADKNYHLVISFAPGESPDQKVLIAIEERVCAAIGFARHQRISVTHHDTDSLHIHVAINKIHPQRYTIHEPFNAYHALGKICAKLEKEFGLQEVSHTAKKARGENSADDMERHADVESQLGWIKRECCGSMQKAQNWPAMHAVMRSHGLTIHERANGLVISSNAGISVKASSVAREFSKASLEKKLGVFQPPDTAEATHETSKQYTKQPLRSRIDTSALYQKYKETQQQATVTRAAEWTKARARKQERIEAAKRSGRLKRAAIKLLSMPHLEKRILYAATSRTLLKEIDAINKAYLRERQEIYDRYRRGTWSDWLCNEARTGNKDALAALRARTSANGLKGNTVRGSGKHNDVRATQEPDTVTKNGTLIYHVGDSAVRDDGSKLKVSRGADRNGLEAALRMAIERYGDCITVNGSAEFKEQIARVAAAARLPVRFDDAALERRRRQLTQTSTQKEKQHENRSRSERDHVGRRPDHSRYGRDKQAAALHAAFATGNGTGRTGDRQSNPGGARRPAPPASAHSVRGMSELGVVHLADRSEVLLPRHVSGHVEHQGTKPDHGVRRHLRRPGRLKQAAVRTKRAPLNGYRPPPPKDRTQAAFTARGASPKPPFLRSVMPRSPILGTSAAATKPNVGRVGTAPPPASKDRLRPLSNVGDVTIGDCDSTKVALSNAPSVEPRSASNPARQFENESLNLSSAPRAAEKYVIEREQKRCNGFDIPKHSRYNFSKEMPSTFAGIRRVDGQALALLKIGDEIFVQPVDESTVRKLKHMALGQQIIVKAHGVLKTKGRRR
jgi:hypothetical protein